MAEPVKCHSSLHICAHSAKGDYPECHCRVLLPVVKDYYWLLLAVHDLCMCLSVFQEMMYIWNGYTVIGKHKDLTEGMLKTLDEAQAQLESLPSM